MAESCAAAADATVNERGAGTGVAVVEPDQQMMPGAGDIPPGPVIWFEVEDALRWFDLAWAITGIQRVCHEVFPAAERLGGATNRIRFCRQSLFSGHFEAIGLADVMAVFDNPPGRHGPVYVLSRSTGRLGVWRKAWALLRAAPRLLYWVYRIVPPIVGDWLFGRFRQRRFVRLVAPGDVIVCLSGPWLSAGYVRRVAAIKRATGARYAVLIHDIIPLIDPTVLTAGMTNSFARWLQEIVAEADALFTVSDFTRRGLLDHAGDAGWRLPPVDVLLIGTGFGDPHAAPARVRPLPDRYALFVSTIEARKNHLFLLRVWRRLVERHGGAAVPSLVLVGRVGWMVDAFMAALRDNDYLDGKVVHWTDVSDGELREIYRHCLFTLFPSLYEGWGSPVAESLTYGKFCIAADRASLPEVGGEFCDYFDPTDEEDALAMIERALFEPGYLAAREARIRSLYRTPSWADCARLLITTLDRRLPR